MPAIPGCTPQSSSSSLPRYASLMQERPTSAPAPSGIISTVSDSGPAGAVTSGASAAARFVSTGAMTARRAGSARALLRGDFSSYGPYGR